MRKVFAKDAKPGATLNTVFRVADKNRHTAKSGKVFLTMTLLDKSGRLDGRIFDNVDAAEAGFENGDYLLVSGKVALFHGKTQLVIEKLEKLDPGPMDEKEFTPPPAPEKPEKPERPERGNEPRSWKQTRQRLLNLLDDPAVSTGVEALLKHLERYIDERVEQRLSGGASSGERTERPTRPQRPARAEREEKKADSHKAEPHKSGLPKDLAFKPFSALAGPAPETPAESSPPTGERS
ncbi:MAG: hypothetical protein JNK82_22500 [Myxococcaceae bacterium]|nr:hypothetical protein [Myxococcaceae bacterium]